MAQKTDGISIKTTTNIARNTKVQRATLLASIAILAISPCLTAAKIPPH